MTFSEMKKWAMDHLKKQMKDEPKESETFKKSIDMLFNMIQKSRGLPVGTIREWKGNKYKKMPNNHWVRVYDKSSRGANHAIAAVLRKIETCQDETELYNIIQANIGRFSDANGIPLPEVEKIHKASDEKKGKFGSGEKNESEKTTIVSQEELRSLSDKLLNKRFKELGEIIPTLKDDKVRREYNENYKNFQKEIERREAESEKKESERNVSTKFKTGDIVTIRSKAKTPNLKVLGSHEADGEIWIETENPETGYKANYNEIYLTKQLKKEENTTIKTPSSEKHQNRSDAMKGNQNAYKGLNLSEETKKDIEEFRPLFDKIQKMISDSKYSAWQVRSGKQLLEKVNSELESLEDEAKESKTDKSSEIKKTKELIEDIKKYEESPLTDILAGFSLVDSYEEIAKKTDNKRYYEIAENELKDAQKNIDNYEKSKSESKQSGKEENTTIKTPSSEKQQKEFDAYAKKCEKEGHKNGRGDSFKPHNYTVNGEPYIVTTDARTMLMKKGSFDDPDPNSKGISDSGIEKVSEDHGQKVSVQDDIDEQIKNCPAKAYLNGENIVPAMMFGDYVIDSKYLKQAQKIFGSLKDCKITGSGDTTSSVRLEKGDYVFVIMPMRDVSPNIIINATDSQRSELQQKKAEADKKYEEEKAKREAEYQARQEQWRKEAEEKKAAEERAKTEKDNEIKAKYHGYFDGKKGLDKSRAITHLEKKYNFDGKVMSVREFVEQAMKDGKEITSREVDKLSGPSRRQWNRMNGYQQEEVERKIKAAGKVTKYGIGGYEFPKTVVDYAKYYKENMNNDSVKKSFTEQVEEIRKSMIV